MHILHFNKPSPLKREGEDALAVNSEGGFFGVMDGVTPLDSFQDEQGHNGAYLAANLFKSYLERSGEYGGLKERIIEANRQLRRMMDRQGIDPSIRHELWATCVAAAHVLPDGEVRYVQLGDCMVIARYVDGSIRVLTENRVRGAVERARAKREQERRNGLAGEDESKWQVNKLAFSRYLANVPDGYGVANGMEEAADHIQSGTIAAGELTHLLLVTDGMYHPDEPLETTMELILREGFERYVERVEAAEQSKGMRPDDRTAILLGW
jgi:hypothetical protein